MCTRVCVCVCVCVCGATCRAAAHLALVHSMTPDWFDEDDPAEVARERKRAPDPSSSSYACCKDALMAHVETDVLEIGRGTPHSPPTFTTPSSLRFVLRLS